MPPPVSRGSNLVSWLLCCRLAVNRHGVYGFAGCRIDLKGTGQVQLFGDFPDGRYYFLAHEPEAPHGVVVGHGAVAVPEEDTARP